MVEITMVIDGGPDATTPTIFDCSNKSLQVGDNLYYVKHSTVGGFSVNNSSMQLIGPVSDVFTTGNKKNVVKSEKETSSEKKENKKDEKKENKKDDMNKDSIG